MSNLRKTLLGFSLALVLGIVSGCATCPVTSRGAVFWVDGWPIPLPL